MIIKSPKRIRNKSFTPVKGVVSEPLSTGTLGQVKKLVQDRRRRMLSCPGRTRSPEEVNRSEFWTWPWGWENFPGLRFTCLLFPGPKLRFHPAPDDSILPINNNCVCVALIRGSLGANPGSLGIQQEFLSPPYVLFMWWAPSKHSETPRRDEPQTVGIRREGP